MLKDDDIRTETGLAETVDQPYKINNELLPVGNAVHYDERSICNEI